MLIARRRTVLHDRSGATPFDRDAERMSRRTKAQLLDRKSADERTERLEDAGGLPGVDCRVDEPHEQLADCSRGRDR